MLITSNVQKQTSKNNLSDINASQGQFSEDRCILYVFECSTESTEDSD